MGKRQPSQIWFPLYADKWIFGSTRIELNDPSERGIFVDLLAIATKHGGYIRANESTPYVPEQLAGLLLVDVKLLNRTIEKCIEHGKLERLQNGTLKVVNWESYQLSERYIRKLENSSGKTEHSSKKEDTRGEESIGDKRIGNTPKGAPRKKWTDYSEDERKALKPVLYCQLYFSYLTWKKYDKGVLEGWGKIGQKFKELLDSGYTKEELAELMVKYFGATNELVKEHGHTVGIFVDFLRGYRVEAVANEAKEKEQREFERQARLAEERVKARASGKVERS